VTLNVNLEDVPWAILEAVRGRIMSNRRRMEQSQQEQQRPALQPKPQNRKFGADGREWKRPEPAAVIDNSESIGLAWVAYRQQGFNAGSFWSNGPGVSGNDGTIQYVTRSDEYFMKVGSGDGKQWIDLTFNLPGVDAWRAGIRSAIAAAGTTPGPITVLRDPDAPGNPILVAFGYELGDYVFGTIGQSTPDDSEIIFNCLPIGNSACVLLITVRASGAHAYSGRIVTQLEPDVGQGKRLIYPLSNANTQLVEIKPEPLDVKDTKAVLVTHTACREITVPQAVLDKIDTAYPSLEWENNRVYRIDTATGNDLMVASTSATTDLTYTVTEPYTLGSQDRTYYIARRKIITAAGFGFQQFGMDARLMDSPFRNLAGGFDYSPAVYALLNRPVELTEGIDFTDPELSFDSYQSVYEQLAAAGFRAPKRIAALDARPEQVRDFEQFFAGDPGDYMGDPLYADPGDNLTSISFASYPRLPVVSQGVAIAIEDNPWRRLTSKPFTKPRVNIYAGLSEDDESRYVNQLPIYFTDWGNPAFCRQQLYQLGFSAADLAP
jgi:hypothetical protein